MSVDALEVRMARLEGAFAQINERLAGLETRLVSEIAALRTELRLELRSEIGGLRTEFRAENVALRRQISTQFYWVLTLILGSILIPILRDLAR